MIQNEQMNTTVCHAMETRKKMPNLCRFRWKHTMENHTDELKKQKTKKEPKAETKPEVKEIDRKTVKTKDKPETPQIEQDILSFMEAYISKHCYPPTFTEIKEGIHVSSTSTIHIHINRMLEKGLLETDADKRGMSRALRIPGYRFVKNEPG